MPINCGVDQTNCSFEDSSLFFSKVSRHYDNLHKVRKGCTDTHSQERQTTAKHLLYPVHSKCESSGIYGINKLCVHACVCVCMCALQYHFAFGLNYILCNGNRNELYSNLADLFLHWCMYTYVDICLCVVASQLSSMPDGTVHTYVCARVCVSIFSGCRRQPLYCFHFALVVWLHVTEIYIYNVDAAVV